MRAGILLIVLYWALFTIRAGLQPKVAAEVKAATYDMKRASGLEKLEHTRRLQCWTVAKWALRVCGWAENVLLGVVILWVAFLLGAVLTGTVIVFGYPDSTAPYYLGEMMTKWTMPIIESEVQQIWQ